MNLHVNDERILDPDVNWRSNTQERIIQRNVKRPKTIVFQSDKDTIQDYFNSSNNGHYMQRDAPTTYMAPVYGNASKASLKTSSSVDSMFLSAKLASIWDDQILNHADVADDVVDGFKKSRFNIPLEERVQHRVLMKNKKAINNSAGRKKTMKQKVRDDEIQRREILKRSKKTSFDAVRQYYKLYCSFDEVVVNSHKVRELLAATGIKQSHIRRMKIIFSTLDIDGSGNIDLDEVLELVRCPKSPFTDELFISLLTDDNEEGLIQFEEFIYIFVTYCMFTKDDILLFCFESYDTDKSGKISDEEYKDLVKNINTSDPTFPGNFNRALELFDVNQDGLIDFEEFVAFESRFPMVLHPAFRLQANMQKYTLGDRVWDDIIRKHRRKKFIDEYADQHNGHKPPLTATETLSEMFKTLLKR